MRLGGEALVHERESLFAGSDAPLELRFLDRVEDFLEDRARTVSQSDQIVSRNERAWLHLLGADLGEHAAAELVVVEVSIARGRVDPAELEKLVDPVLTEESLERGKTHLRRAHRTQVILDEPADAVGHGVRTPQALADLARHRGTTLRMAIERDLAVSSRRAFALGDVVQQHAERERFAAKRRRVDALEGEHRV